jgi:hypothetical protein
MTWQDDLRRTAPSGIRGAELAVLRALAEFADYDDSGGGCFPSQNAVAARAGVSRATVSRSIRSLTERGLIAVTSGAQTGRPNDYRIVVDAVRSMIRVGAPPRGGCNTTRQGVSRSASGGVASRDTTKSTPHQSPSRVPSPVEQLTLALLGRTEGEGTTPSEQATAAAATAELAATGATPDDVRCARRGWAQLGWRPGGATPGALVRHWSQLLDAGRPRRPTLRGRTASADCPVCHGDRFVLDDDARARPCACQAALA